MAKRPRPAFSFLDSTIFLSLRDNCPPVVIQVLFLALSPLGMLWMAARLTFCTWRLFGIKKMARRGSLMAKLRYRAPLREVAYMAPGPQSIAALSACFIIIHVGPTEIATNWRPYFAVYFVLMLLLDFGYLRWAPLLATFLVGLGCYLGSLATPAIAVWFVLYAVVLLASIAICSPIICCAPPAVLYLGISGYGQFMTMKRLQRSICPTVISLINQKNSSVVIRYRRHYRGLGPNATGVRYDSLRTEDDKWERTVVEMTDDVPVIVLDVRETSPIVLSELMIVLTGARIKKTLFIVDTSAQRDQVGKIILDPGILAEVYKRTYSEDDAIEKVESITGNPSFLAIWQQIVPENLDFDRQQQKIASALNARKATFEALIDDIAKGSGRDEVLEMRITEFASIELPSEQKAEFTADLEAAITLAKSHFEHSSITLKIHVNNLAQAELGVRSPQGVFRVFESADNLDPTRAMLQAFLKAVLGDSL